MRYDANHALLETDLPGVKLVNRGKVRDVYDLGDDGKLNVGTPRVEGASVSGKVLDQFRAKKIVVFKMKRRKGYRRTHGHRQSLTRIEIGEIKG